MENKNLSLLVLSFFAFLFILFLFFNPGITGFASFDLSSIDESQVTDEATVGTFDVTIDTAVEIPVTAEMTVRVYDETGDYASTTITIADVVGLSYDTPETYAINLDQFDLRPEIPGEHSVEVDIRDGGASLFSDEKLVNFTGFYQVFVGTGTSLDTLDIERDEFMTNDTLACLLSYPALGTLEVSFYKPGDSLLSPTAIKSGDDIICDPDDPELCAALFHVNQTTLGQWACLATATVGDKTAGKLATNSLTMVNAPPIQIQDFENISLEEGGEITIDLDDHFIDPDGNDIEYDIFGAQYLDVDIVRSIATLSNIQDIQLLEQLIVSVYDGFDQVEFSLSVDVAGSTAPPPTTTPPPTPIQECIPAWECAWSECINSIETKTCTRDLNNCGQIPPAQETRACEVSSSIDVSDTTTTPGLGNIQLPEFLEEKKEAGLLAIIVVVLGVLGAIVGISIFVIRKRNAKNKEGEGAIKEEKIEDKTKGPITGSKEGISFQKGKVGTEKAAAQTIHTAQPAQDLGPLEKYADDAIVTQGKDAVTVTKELTAAGWKEADVNRVVAYAGVKKFIKTKLAAGFDKAKIKETLKAKNWKDDVLEKIFKELGVQ